MHLSGERDEEAEASMTPAEPAATGSPELAPSHPLEPISTTHSDVPSGASAGAAQAAEANAAGQGVESWSLVALIPFDRQDPPADTPEELALETWSAVTALWHPSLLARATGLPRIEPVECPSEPVAREIRIVAASAIDRLPHGYLTRLQESNAVLITAGKDRDAVIREAQERLGVSASTSLDQNDPGLLAAEQFLSLGLVRWMLRDLAKAMGHAEQVDEDSLERELHAGASSWQVGDTTGATNRLRAAYEVLTQARERFYGADTYIIDICLLDAAMPAGVLAEPLSVPSAISFVGTAQAIQNQTRQDPERMAALRQAITDGWADVAGGSYSEAEDSLLPIESIIWQFRKATQTYRANLDERNVETYARRRFGLHVMVPQLARRFGLRFGLHLGFDAGQFPIYPETKRLWESPDGSSIESLTRPPLAADKAVQGMALPWRLATTMKDDYAAVLPMVHWPEPVAPWYVDLRRAAGFSPVLGRWTTLNDFFHQTDRPYETFRPEPDSYITPFLAQAAARRDPSAISKFARQHKLRAQLEAGRAIEAMARAIASATTEQIAAGDPAFVTIEEQIETRKFAEAQAGLETSVPSWGERLADGIIKAATSRPDSSKRPGYLVINPLGVPRRAAVILPDAALDLRPDGALRAAQFMEDGVAAIVDLPAFGFAWVPKATDPTSTPADKLAVSAKERTLRNETMAVEIDAKTGGIRGVSATGDTGARVGQQLVIAGLKEIDDKPAVSKMVSDGFEIEYGGPALVQGSSRGGLFDPISGQRLANFTQRYRLWTGRPILEVKITLSDLEPSWKERLASADPWSNYLACRWAWPDANATVRRGVFLTPEMTDSQRPETPDMIDLTTRSHRTALLFGGLPYHKKASPRMLDTLLVAGSESTLEFSVGVALDLEYPFHAAQEWISPAIVVPTDDGPPAIGPRGWLVQLDHKGIAVLHASFLEDADDGRGWGMVFHLLETAGYSSRCRLKLFRNPLSARQVDFTGETIIEMTVDEDAVRLDLTPHELACVEVRMG
jgi:alpha-mannosidase